MGEKSFIPKVLQKEAEIEEMLHAAKKEAEGIIDSAKHEARKSVEAFEEKLPNMAQERYNTGIKSCRVDAQQIKEAGQIHAQRVKTQALEKLDLAVEQILQAVLPTALPDEEVTV